jgi:hypothetical protein
MKRTSTIRAAFVAFALSVGMGGCIVYTDPTPQYSQTYVSSAPPARYQETRTSYPGSGYFWVDGYWSWRGNQWAWVGGHWERERTGYIYVAPTYQYTNGKHVYVDGGWQQQKGYKTSNKKQNNGYSNGQGSNGNNGNGNGNNGYNGNGSNGNNGNGNNQKCPQGYVWSKGQCQKSY